MLGMSPVLLGAMIFCGCGHPAQETAAHKIADALPTLMGPAAHYAVQVDGAPLALTRGRARAVHIQAEDVQLSPALTLDTLDADAEDVSFNTQTHRLDHIGRTKFAATIDQSHLTAYLAQSKPLLPGLVVTLRTNDVEAQVPVTAFGLHSIAYLTGSFTPNADDASKLDFVTSGAQIGQVPLPASLVNLAIDQLNPVVNLPGLKVTLTITNAFVENSRLNLQGIADLNGLTRR